MRLFEDTLFGDEEVRFDDPAPRAIYVSAGSISVDAEDVPLDGGVVLTDAATLCAGGDGATVWRWEVRSSNVDADVHGHRTTLRLAGRIDPAAIADELLIRLDSVAFPPGGAALLHTHQGPGIRCLREGEIRIDTEDRSSFLLSRRRLVRKRTGTRLCASVDQCLQPFHSHDGPSTISARRVVHSLRQRRRPGQAEVANLSGVFRETHKS